MTFEIHQLDNLDYDDAEPLLEDYIEEALQAFVNSKTGQAHVKKYPQGGFWIGTFIEMAYIYGGYTLPKMTKGSAQEAMEYILPRKLTLMDPSDTDDAIAELTAFWNFIDEVYRFRSAKAIAKYLKSIEDKFPQWMFDPNRGGFAKQFMMQGAEAGFDMTTQEGIEAFRAEYNRNLPSSPMSSGLPNMADPSMIAGEFEMTTPPPDMAQAFEMLGIEMPKEGEIVNSQELILRFLGAMQNLDPDRGEELLSVLEAGAANLAPPSPQQLNEELDDFRLGFLQASLKQEPQLTDEFEAILRSQTITETVPGTVLQDFETVLDFVQANKVTVSGKLKHISLKFLEDLNQRLCNPINLDLKRPQQKSYPNIHGLYLLLRATGIGEIVPKGKQLRLQINPEIRQSWQQLNPTEKYFSLIEVWFLRGFPQILGEERSGPMTMGDRCLHTWHQLSGKKSYSFSSYAEQDNYFYYWPGITNIALMELFGILQLTSGKPEQGKGWRIKKLEALPFGRALMALLHDASLETNGRWTGAVDSWHPLGELQPMVQPYFPEWEESLQVPSNSFRPDRHIFKVSLGKIWRRIAISGEATLAHLSGLILDSVDFDRDHLDQFTFEMPNGRTVEAAHPGLFDGPILPIFGRGPQYTTTEFKIGDLPLKVGSTMEYLFDFGDNWEFQVQLEAIEPIPEEAPKGVAKVKGKKSRKSAAQKALGEIIEVHGNAPQQYPVYDDW